MKHLKIIFKIVFIYIPISLVALSLLWVLLLKWVPVKYTPLMAIRSYEYRNDNAFKTQHTWRNLEDISQNLVLAVIASEDNKFLTHNGFDWDEIRHSISDSKRGKKLRGASTISQQTAKNVFLYPGRSWIRKGLEVYYTWAIEIIWGKRRIMEVYLNVAEMGKGIYGAEAASARFFYKPSSKLTRYESSLIAAVLPNPLYRKVNKPSGYVIQRSGDIRVLMGKIEYPGWNKIFYDEK